MTWSLDRRLDYIDWHLSIHGKVQRADLARQFDISMQQASADLGAFEAAHAGAMRYDKSVKRYVPAGQPKRHRAKLYDFAWAAEEQRFAAAGG